MTIQQVAMAKLQELPEALASEVSDFIDFLILKNNAEQARIWDAFREAQTLAEAGIDEYRRDLENYEEQLARGEIQW